MELSREYAKSAIISFPLITAGAQDFNQSATVFSGESQISKDEGAFVNTAGAVVTLGNGIYSLTLTSTEMTALRIVITFIDAPAKDWEDQAILITTENTVGAR